MPPSITRIATATAALTTPDVTATAPTSHRFQHATATISTPPHSHFRTPPSVAAPRSVRHEVVMVTVNVEVAQGTITVSITTV
jgi:hypothetical protein